MKAFLQSLPARFRAGRYRDAGLSIVLAVQGAIIFIIGPLAATGVVAPVIIEIFRLGMTAAAIILLTRNRAAAAVIVATFLLSLVLSLIAHPGMAAATSYVRIAAGTAFDIAVAAVVFRIAFGPGRVSIHRIMGAVILYLSIGLIFSNAYRACAMGLHPAFNGLGEGRGGGISALLYFSLSTLTTGGYGDITPVHPFVRSLANLEAVIGQLFPATLLARLVTLHAAAGASGDATRMRDDDA